MNRRLMALLLAVTTAGAAVRLWGIGLQTLTLDEILMHPTAVQYMRFGVPRPEMPFHPNLRNILLYLSERVLGSTAIGLKGWSLLFGILSVLLLGLLVWRLTHDKTASLIAAVLLASDPLSIYLSRSGLQDGWAPFWTLVALHVLLSVMETPSGAITVWGPLLCGALFGLGVTSKFYVVPIEAACILYVFVVFWRQGRGPLAIWTAGATLFSSLLVFILTYAPWFAAGHSVSEWLTYQQALLETMTSHSRGFPDNRDIRAWEWFVRPFVAWQEMQYASPLPRMAIALASPLTWLVVLPAMAWTAIRQRSERGTMILLGLFLAAYVPLLTVNRFIYVFSATIVLPFAFALIGIAVSAVARRFGTWTALAYAVLVIAMSAALFPGVTGHALDHGYLRQAVRRAAGTATLIPPLEQQLNQ